MEDNKLLTVDELAEILRTTKGNISNQISRGNMAVTIPPGFKQGRKWLWRKETLETWLKNKENQFIQNTAPHPIPQPSAGIRRVLS
jgi:excisionase family DNA binding protein